MTDREKALRLKRAEVEGLWIRFSTTPRREAAKRAALFADYTLAKDMLLSMEEGSD